jgi:hypothetical protein
MFGFFLFAGLFVALCLFTAEPQVAIAPVPVEEEPAHPVPAQAAAVATPVAVAVVKVEAPAKPIAEMTSAELRKECSRRGIAWRGVREGGKHLLKHEMVKALS